LRGFKTWAIGEDVGQPGLVQVGDAVQKLGAEFIWSKNHWRSVELEKLRAEGDGVADRALDFLALKAKADPLTTIDSKARNDGNVKLLQKQLEAVPSWVDWDSVARGQAFFRSHAAAAGISLLHLALVGGFSIPKVNKVLNSTGYLSRSEKESRRRVGETSQMIVDCMQPGGLSPGTGMGWKSCIRVRFLHAKVRRRLRRSPRWHESDWGVPINQEDMCGTLLAFSYLVIEAVEVMGFRVSERERQDYMHLWRLIGFYSGISEKNNPCISYEKGRAFLQSLIMHIFEPDDSSVALAHHMLHAGTGQRPFYWNFAQMCEMSRMLMGDTLADALQLPPHSWWQCQLHKIGIAGLRMSVSLCHIPVIGPIIGAAKWNFLQQEILRMQGGQRTQFFMQHKPDAKMASILAGESKDGSGKTKRSAGGILSRIFLSLCSLWKACRKRHMRPVAMLLLLLLLLLVSRFRRSRRSRLLGILLMRNKNQKTKNQKTKNTKLKKQKTHI
jgi:hypothetical protein